MTEQESADRIVKNSDRAAQNIIEVYRLKGVNPAYVSSIIREAFGDIRCVEIGPSQQAI